MSMSLHLSTLYTPESQQNLDQRVSPTQQLMVIAEPGCKRTGRPLDGGILGPIPNGRPRRVNRDHETDRVVVFSAVPRGSVRAAHGDQVKAKLAAHAEYARCYRNRRTTISAVLDVLINCMDFQSMTTRPGWKLIAETAQIHRSTVGRTIELLKAWGFLGVVATGRTAAHAAADKDGVFMNEAAVYVLCVPSMMAVISTAAGVPVVDENATPPAVCGNPPFEVKTTPTRAQEKNIHAETATPPLQNRLFGAASSAPTAQVPWRPETRWPLHRTTSRKNERRHAAAELHYRLFPLRCMTLADVASICREYFQSGWTVADITHALDWQADGTKWPHSGAPATKQAWRMRGWMKNRLDNWRNASGEIMRSKDQHDIAEREALKRHREAEKQRILERQAEHAAHLEKEDSPTKITALATIRALFDASR